MKKCIVYINKLDIFVLLIKTKNMVGIYKITSPDNLVYIGQSLNVKNRIKKYNLKNTINQKKLYQSFILYGIERHVFEIIEECDFSELGVKERYWQIHYNSIENGLNLRLSLGDKKYISNESMERILKDKLKR